jgi:hypothetical protein
MLTIERYGNGFLLKTKPSVTKGGTRASNTYEMKVALDHYYGDGHGNTITSCPFCRDIEREGKGKR